jgi:large subunit ribosomal protein L4
VAEAISIQVVSQHRETVGELTLPEKLFSGPVRSHLLYEVVRMQQANRRAGTHATKTRGAVSGGGAKPWRQKGTGRARAGSSRSPIWVGGATIFGPQPRDYSYRMPASARKAALCAALAAKARDGKIIVLDKLTLEHPKTKLLAKVLKDLEASNALIVTAAKDESLERAGRNLPNAKVLRAEGANVYDLLRYDRLVLLRDAIDALQKRLGV